MSNIIETVRNIYDLRNFNLFDPNTDNIVVFVQGYINAADGGGGDFVFKRFNEIDPLAIPSDDEGIIIESVDTEVAKSGVWIRHFTGLIDVRFYGVLGQGEITIDSYITTTTTTQRIQKAIDYASKSIENSSSSLRPYGYGKSNVVFFPNGDYQVGQIIMKKGVTLMGSSTAYTSINSIDDGNEYLIVIEEGIVSDCHISKMTFMSNRLTYTGGPSQKFKGCMYFEARTGSVNSGGLWSSTIKDVYIHRFMGHSLNFEGGSATSDYQYNIPNQFITLENVAVESVGDIKGEDEDFVNNYHALQMIGQNGQFSFINCRFDGGAYQTPPFGYVLNGINVYIATATETIVNPSVLSFNTCTFQLGETGIFIDGCNNIKIDECWFESFERAISIIGTERTAKSINILNNLFLNSAGNGGGELPPANSGRVIYAENAQINVQNNFVIDVAQNEATEFIAVDFPPTVGINGSGNYFEPTVTGRYLGNTKGLKKNIDVVNLTTTENLSTSLNLIDLGSAKTIFLDNLILPIPPIKTVNEIKSSVIGGEYIFVRANQGPIQFTEYFNLYLGGSAVTINNGECALFIKIDGEFYTKTGSSGNRVFSETYQLISIR